MKYRTFLIASALCLSAGNVVANTNDSQLVIGAWNIEWLGAKNRPDQSPTDIASYIAAANVDVLAMSEISITRSGNGEPFNRLLDEAFGLLNEQGADWQYKLFGKNSKAGSSNDQWTALAWNGYKVQQTGGPWNVAGVDEQKRIELLGADSKKVPLNRTPHAVKLSAGPGKSDFLFVPLHLKANGKGPTVAQRELEVHLILKGLEPIRAEQGEHDVILLGDTNMLSTSEPGAQVLSAYGMRDCNAADHPTWLSDSPRFSDAPFDRIFVMRDQPETASTCVEGGMPFEVVKPGDWVAGMDAAEFRQRLSDHQMVRTTLNIGADDD
jgi:endonuclease/exonuclease/phosphatase family metal-dependent hydrolase